MDGEVIQLFGKVGERELKLPKNLVLTKPDWYDFLFGCNHDFNRPVRLMELDYPKQFTGHQTCTECGATRFFDTRSWTHGPMFRRIFSARGK